MRKLVITAKVTNKDADSFKQYLKEIYLIKTLTSEEELYYTQKASNGDVNAKKQLIERNLRFVVSVAKQYATQQYPLSDLVNEGNIGLMMAVEKFKPEMGFKFISYAVWWIRKIIIEHINNHGRLVRLPANKINNLSKLDKQINELEQKLGKHVSPHEAMLVFSDTESSMNLSDSNVSILETLSSFTIDSLDKNIGDESNPLILEDTIIDDTTFINSDVELINNEMKKHLSDIIDSLKPKEKDIIVKLFGLDGCTPRTLNDVGEEFGVTREAIRQIREKTLKKIKEKLEEIDY